MNDGGDIDRELDREPGLHDDRWLGRYHRLALVSTIGVGVLTVAGGIVRLTGSGLGCDDWPACNDERFIDVSSGHTAIEQVNRLLSGLIGLPVLLLLIAGFLVRPRAGLRWPAIGVFTTVVANAVVGGLAVRGDLHPALVQSHFLLAMGSILFGVIAAMRSQRTPLVTRAPRDVIGWLSVVVGTLTVGALVTGTVVTGTGPHAGDEEARRFGFDISSVARIHGLTVLLTVAVALALAWQLTRHARRAELATAMSSWLFLGLLQGAIGYVQYFNGVPELLVAVHILLATALWVVTVRFCLLALSEAADDSTAQRPASQHDVHTGVDGGAPAPV